MHPQRREDVGSSVRTGVTEARVAAWSLSLGDVGSSQGDALAAYGPHKTLQNRWKRWSDKGIFVRMMAGLAAEHGEEKTVMIDATYLKAYRTATSMGFKKGGAVD
jgi:transposase